MNRLIKVWGARRGWDKVPTVGVVLGNRVEIIFALEWLSLDWLDEAGWASLCLGPISLQWDSWELLK